MKALLQVGQDLSQQSKPEQLQLGGLANSVHSPWPATSNGIAVLQEGFGAQGLGCVGHPPGGTVASGAVEWGPEVR